MILVDVNVLVAAHRVENPEHETVRRWLEAELNSDRTYGMSELALSGFLRVVTHPSVFREPTPLPVALDFVTTIANRSNCSMVRPSLRHWSLFLHLCERAGSVGNHVPDAYFAALAIEAGCEWITLDRGFGRFPGLRWRLPG